MPRTILVLISLLALVSACGGASSSGAGKKDVVAAFYPLAWATARVGGDEVEVRNLTRPGVEPHDVELSPRDVEEVRSADIVFYLGSGFQPAIEDAVEGAEGETINLLEGGRLIRPEEAEGELTADPHVWLDPVRYSEMVREIADALGHSGHTPPLVEDVQELDAEYREGLENCRRREIVTTHAAFGYLAQRYGLEQIPLTGLSPETEPTPRDLERLVDRVRESGAKTIFFETLVSPRLAETVARETGAKTDVLDPLEGLSGQELRRGENYLSVMRENLTSLRRALNCR